jgi:hypothetical protein
VSQPEPFRAEPYVRNVAVSAKPFTGRAQLPWDEAVRTGTFVRGMRDVYVRYELGEYAGGAERVQVVRPDGSLAVDDAEPARTVDPAGGPPSFAVHERVRFDVVGAWRLRYVLDGKTLADTPLRVVAKRTQIRNRPPFGVTATVTTTQGIAECVVSARIDARDPDYDVVRYRYRWTVGGEVARTVTSAMLSDYVAVPAGQVAHCAVTPSDGKLAAATASS